MRIGARTSFWRHWLTNFVIRLPPIRNALEVMKRAEGNSTLIEQARNMMERQLGHMVRLVDDLLDLSRITRGKVHIRQERVELEAALRNAVETARPFIEGQAHELTITLPPQPIHLDVDQTRLSQIISNLPTTQPSIRRRAVISGSLPSSSKAKSSCPCGTPASASPPSICRTFSRCFHKRLRRSNGRMVAWASGLRGARVG